jgi:uncharacterized repeat protein (TIGR01451 family)
MHKKASLIAMLAVLASLLLPVMATPASATHVEPIKVGGNPTCGDLVPGSIELRVDPGVAGTYTQSLPGGGTWTVTIVVNSTADGPTFDWTSNIGVDGVFAKGGAQGGNLYLYAPPALSDTGLHAPGTPTDADDFAGLSHISFCHVPRPDLNIQKSADAVNGTVQEGGSFTYTITVGNTGDAQATNVTVTDDLDDSLTAVTATPTQGTCTVGAGNTLSCNLGTIAAGGSATVTIGATAPELDASKDQCSLVLKNTATVDSTQTEPENSNEVVVTVEGDRQIVVSKTIPFAVDEAVTFEFTVTGPGGPYPVSVTIPAGQTTASFTLTGLAAGDYIVTELDTTPYGEAPPVNVDLDPACSATAPFANTFDLASAKVQKVTVPEGFEDKWEFTLYKDDGDGIQDPAPGGGDQVYAGPLTTDATGLIDFGTIADEGDYYILETEQGGWDSDGGTLDGSGGDPCFFTVNYPADADKVFSCTFTNTAAGSISVEKKLDGGTSTDQFTFELRELSDDNDPLDPTDDTVGAIIGSPVSVTADGTPVLLGDELVLGTYTVCEIVMPGFSTTLDGGGGQYTLFVGDSNERICTDVTLTAETTDVTLKVDNISPPGGEQRTIGFWKNWTSCDGHGNQDPVLDETLTAAGGILVGTLNVDECTEAVRILNKSTVNTGTKKASDPLFNLAAQYLAARLNQEAGAEDSCITQALTEAQALLLANNFNGITHDSLTNAEKTQANDLANTLDDYNNGFLC